MTQRNYDVGDVIKVPSVDEGKRMGISEPVTGVSLLASHIEDTLRHQGYFECGPKGSQWTFAYESEGDTICGWLEPWDDATPANVTCGHDETEAAEWIAAWLLDKERDEKIASLESQLREAERDTARLDELERRRELGDLVVGFTSVGFREEWEEAEPVFATLREAADASLPPPSVSPVSSPTEES